ncbi:MAG: hypothetical protein RR280_10055 [Bacteroidaceae bacterium]
MNFIPIGPLQIKIKKQRSPIVSFRASASVYELTTKGFALKRLPFGASSQRATENLSTVKKATVARNKMGYGAV